VTRSTTRVARRRSIGWEPRGRRVMGIEIIAGVVLAIVLTVWFFMKKIKRP
jgi:hypothetical protein